MGQKEKLHLSKMLIQVFLTITLIIFVAILSGCGHTHQYTSATCETPKTCVKCGETQGEPLGHRWTIGLDTVSCSRCNKLLVNTLGVKKKAGEGLSSAAKALIYYNLDYYFTATDAKGKYLYSEEQVYSYIQGKFDITRDYIDNHIWNAHAFNDYSQYNQK